MSRPRYIILCLLLSGSGLLSQSLQIFVSDAGNFSTPPWQILRYDQDGTNPVIFIEDNLNWPQDILFLESSNTVLISNLGTGQINRHDASTGEYLSNFARSISGPTRMKIGPDSLVYVLQWGGNGRILRYDLTGNSHGEFTLTGVTQSIGLDWDADGNLYVSSFSGDHVRKFDSNGIDQGLFIDSFLFGPTNIWFDANGDLLVADYNGSAVKRFNSDGIFMGDFISGLGQAEGVAYFPNGDVLIGNGATQSVKRFDSNGAYIQDLIPSGFGGLVTPNAIVIRETPTTALGDFKPSRPDRLELLPNYPNPFNGQTIIRYTIPLTGYVSLSIVNMSGRHIRWLEVENKAAGWHEQSWDTLDDAGRPVPTGLYLLKLQTSQASKTSKIVFLK